MVALIETDGQRILSIGNPHSLDRVELARYLNLYEWPDDDSVDHATINHVLEYLDGHSRIFFINQLHRVMKNGSKAILYVPYWSSPNAYADPYLAWPPITEMSLQYLADAEFRIRNRLNYAEITADFVLGHGYSYAPETHIRSDPHRDYVVRHHLGVVTQLVYTLIKR